MYLLSRSFSCVFKVGLILAALPLTCNVKPVSQCPCEILYCPFSELKQNRVTCEAGFLNKASCSHAYYISSGRVGWLN